MLIKISPNYDDSYLKDATYEKKVNVLSDCINGWFLNWAEKLNVEEHAGFAALHLCFSYFEFIAQFIYGESSKGKSKEFFKKGICTVFPSVNEFENKEKDKFIDILYNNGRCGFFHSGMAKKGIIIFDHENIITLNEDNIFIDRYKIVERIKSHFKEYINKLKTTDNIIEKDNFLKTWENLHS
ncbi:MAG: hypothetical protein WC738_07435 [Candidatus Omnitrophota bacterium]